MQIKRREHVKGLFILQFHDWAFPMLIAAGAGKLFHMVLARRKKERKKKGDCFAVYTPYGVTPCLIISTAVVYQR